MAAGFFFKRFHPGAALGGFKNFQNLFKQKKLLFIAFNHHQSYRSGLTEFKRFSKLASTVARFL